jgi:hypothetical protein
MGEYEYDYEEEQSRLSSSKSQASTRSTSTSTSSTSADTSHSHSQDSAGDSADAWPEWSAPTWAAHRFDEGEGEGARDGVQDVVFTGRCVASCAFRLSFLFVLHSFFFGRFLDFPRL